jgi:hypothetical protein
MFMFATTAGNMYWRFDEGIQQVELDYPRDLSMWKGVPDHFDAVFQVRKARQNCFSLFRKHV